MKVPGFLARLIVKWRARDSFVDSDASLPPELEAMYGDTLTHRGVRLRVVKVVGGPLPVVLLSPLGLSKREYIKRGQSMRRAKRIVDERQRFVEEQIARELKGL